MSDISVKLPDGSEKSLPEGSTAADLAAAIGPRLAKSALIATVDGEQRDLSTPLHDGERVAIVTADTQTGLETIRHSTAHVLAQAVLELFPGATYAIGPAIENGFYYDFELPGGRTFSQDDLARIEAKMREIVAADQPFVRSELASSDALEVFRDHPYKREIIDKVDASEVAGDGTVSIYRNTDAFLDMCRGPHVPSTGRLGHFALQRVAGAYWRGDHTRPMLQRIYGTAWATKKDLDEHLHRLAEAEKRDHRRLAAELDLVSWPEELGPGLAVWHPKGATVRRLMEDYSRGRHERGGYQFVFSPHIAKSLLWETSGHLDWYAEGMYPPMEMDGATYYPKPMNCPFHIMVFKSQQRSYRELPLRLFELGAVYRYELSGAVHGLLRSRGFTQDDSHIFCTREMVPAELSSLLNFVIDVLRAFGFDEFQFKLSTKPVEKFVGDDELWDMATDGLRHALETAGLEYTVDEGGGAFYGPKIDVDVKDAIGRSWQLSTLQLDFNLPERFGLEYIGPDGQPHRPVMIHRALFGSVERFFGVLLEHFAGAFPAWLAPVQARVLPVAAAHEGYASKVVAALREHGFRADSDEADEQLGKRIRNAKLEKLPYVLVVGDDDVAHGTVGVNPRGGDVERGVALDAFVERLAADVAAHS
jgi:threonyl-tRNA synthetase